MVGMNQMAYTVAGSQLLSEAIANEATFSFTKMIMGSGHMPDGTSMAQMKAVVSPAYELAINDIKRLQNTSNVLVTSYFNNLNMTQSFLYRELGIYAKLTYQDGTQTNDVLYLYGNSGDYADLINPVEYGFDEQTISVIIYTGNQANVSVQPQMNSYATKEYVESAKMEVTSATVPITQKGVAGGVAELGDDGKVLSAQLPSYVDDVLEYDNATAFPATGESGKIYVDTTTNLTYRWSGSGYVEISQSLALGETASTAFRGDRGKQAYDNAAQALELFNSIMDEETIQLAQELGFLSGGADVTE